MTSSDASAGGIAVLDPRAAVLPPAPIRPREQASVLYPWYVLGVLFLVYVFNFIDRQILSILAQGVKQSLRVSDAQLGFLYGTAFAIFYAVFGIPLGRLADGWFRGRLIAAGLAAWSAMTMASGLAMSYGQLVFARMGVGVGEASASPAAYSLLADYFPARRRAFALAIYSAGLFVGMGLSLPLGVGLPGLLLALWVLTLREPLRGSSEGAGLPVLTPGVWRRFARELAAIVPPFTIWSAAQFPGALRRNLVVLAAAAGGAALLARGTGDVAQWLGIGMGMYAIASWAEMLYATDRPAFTMLFGTRAVALLLLGVGAIGFVGYSEIFWLAPYTMRTFGLPADVAGLALGVPFGFAAAAGCTVGGRLSDAWKRRDARGRIFLCMLAALLPVPLVLAALHTSHVRVMLSLNPFISFFATMWMGSAAAAIQDCVLPRMRATAGAIYLCAISILGLGLGPYSTGKIAGIAGSLKVGLVSVQAVVPLALLLLWVAAQRIAAAEDTRIERARAAGERC